MSRFSFCQMGLRSDPGLFPLGARKCATGCAVADTTISSNARAQEKRPERRAAMHLPYIGTKSQTIEVVMKPSELQPCIQSKTLVPLSQSRQCDMACESLYVFKH